MNEETRRDMRDLGRQFFRWALIALAVLAALYGLVRILGLEPPREFTIATGRQGGAYYAFAQQYQERFAAEGYTLNIRETAGSLETVDLLNAGEVDAGFVQNTVARQRADAGLSTLAAIYYEAFWVFGRSGLDIDDLDSTQGLRISVGEEGSATQTAALTLLNLNGVSSENSTIISQPSSEAAEELKNGEIDIMIFVAGAEASLVGDLLRSPGVTLLPIRRAEAYAARFKNVNALVLPEGALDLANNIPPQDTPIIAARATLVAGDQLHPDLARLLLIIATEVHQNGGVLEQVNEFPSSTFVGIPMNADAERFLENGPTGLERYLPLWLASRLERFLFLLLPIALILFPLLRGLPTLAALANQYRVKRRYGQLRELEKEYSRHDQAELDRAITQLETWQQELGERMKVPTLMLDQLYNLRRHTDLTLERLQRQKARHGAAPAPPEPVAPVEPPGQAAD